MKRIKSTINQQTAFKIMLRKLMEHEPIVLGKIMREAGYAAATCINPQANLTSKPGWEVLKNRLDSGGAIQTFNELVAPENEDKRTRLAAAIEITKITDGYPKADNKVIGLFEKVGNDFKNEPTATENKLPAPSWTTESPGMPER